VFIRIDKIERAITALYTHPFANAFLDIVLFDDEIVELEIVPFTRRTHRACL
jgi:hypothetical protein